MARKHPDTAAVILELQRLHAAGRILTKHTLSSREPELWRNIRRLFPSCNSALSAAGIEPKSPDKPFRARWPREAVIQQLKDHHARRIIVNAPTIFQIDRLLYGAVIRRFKTFEKALKAAGFDPVKLRPPPRWTRQSIIAETHALHEKGENLAPAQLVKNHYALLGAMLRHFGSYRKAMKAAGLEPVSGHVPGPRIWTDEKILQGIRDHYEGWWKDHPRSQPPPGLITHKFTLYRAAAARYGSLDAALKAAGVASTTHRTTRVWTNELVLGFLRQHHAEGKPLSRSSLKKADPGIDQVCRVRFGSVREAVEAAGLPFTEDPSPRTASNHWTEEMVLATLKEMQAKGEDLRYTTIRGKNPLLFWAAYRLFGSYPNAMRQAGVDYWTMSQNQLAAQRRRAAEIARPDEGP
jgi:hypothetical protein